MGVCATLIVEVRARVAKCFSNGWVRCDYFVWSCNSDGVVVLCGLVIDDVVVAGGRFLGSGRVRGVERSIGVAFCYGDVLLGKRVIV